MAAVTPIETADTDQPAEASPVPAAGRAAPSSGAVVSFEPGEAALLASVAAQVVELLAVTESGPDDQDPGAVADGDSQPDLADPLAALVRMSFRGVPKPQDPALARLLPDAYSDDEDASAEFRRFTDSDLRATKTAALRTILGSLEQHPPTEPLSVTLDRAGVVDWLHGLADIRLALGTRLDVTEDIDRMRRSLRRRDTRAESLAIYDWLSWLQDALVLSLTGE